MNTHTHTHVTIETFSVFLQNIDSYNPTQSNQHNLGILISHILKFLMSSSRLTLCSSVLKPHGVTRLNMIPFVTT